MGCGHEDLSPPGSGLAFRETFGKPYVVEGEERYKYQRNINLTNEKTGEVTARNTANVVVNSEGKIITAYPRTVSLWSEDDEDSLKG
jgi:hypothetical protein